MTNVRTFIRKYGWGYLFILPSLLTFALFTFFPVVWSLIISFQDYSIARGGTWVTPFYQNYQTAFTMLNGLFITSIRNTVFYTIFTVTSSILFGLILASLIQPLSNRMRTFFRAAYYLPAVTSALIIGLTWAYIYNAQWGFATYLTRALGLPPIRFLSDPNLALPAITLSAILTLPATAIVLYSAAMGSIPKEYYEAAELDGANPIQRWWNVTIPLLKSTTLYLVVLYTIASFEVFERIYIMVPSGVGNSTQTIVTQIYANGFKEFEFGIASAQAFVLFAIIAALAIFQFRVFRSDVEY